MVTLTPTNSNQEGHKRHFLREREREILREADFELAFQVSEKVVKSLSPAEDIVDDDTGFSTSIKSQAASAGQLIPGGIHIMNEDNKYH